jgi:hypothetical protein
MPIYRGDGGSGDSSTNALANEVAQDAADAANSASQAATSASAAANSATNAANSATAAASSETAAETAETNAETAETNATASATAAATSETNAATSETNAATSETNAATSETNAASSATSAATSATTATTQASAASTSATNAADSETNAATSETNAANSATQASTSATNAATSASDAATTYDNFDDRYLGEKTSDPSVDNDGDALITGALYFNSTAGEMRVWDGSAWEAAYLPASGYLHLSGGTMTGALELHANPSNNLEAATKQYVDDVAAEGIQYHTPVRVEVEGNLTVTYNNGTAGVGATLTNAGTQAALVIDDITMVVNDRVLIYEQTDATQNGIYTVTDIGSASTNWVLTRATDADSYAPSDPDALAQGSGFFVQEGTLGAGEKYVCNTVGTITFGTTNISFVQVATAQIYTAGTGISLNGSVINNTGLLTTGSTATDLAITSADINGGNIDGTIIGATTPAAATFAAFTSNGIDDNATGEVLSLSDSGAVIEINQSSPGSGLDFRQVSSTGGTGIAANFELVGAGGGTAFLDFRDASGNGNLWLGTGSVSSTLAAIKMTTLGVMSFITAGSERMSIDSSGYVGIGSTPESQLDVRSSTGTASVTIEGSGGITGAFTSGGGSAGTFISTQDTATLGLSFGFHGTRNTSGHFNSTSIKMILQSDGDLHADGDVIAYSTTISDQRLKDDVETIETALDKVGNLRGVTYTWNAGSRAGQRDYGVIAQEVEQVIPEIVREKEMALIDGETYKTVDYEKLTAVLIEAIKELRAEVEVLKNGSSD